MLIVYEDVTALEEAESMPGYKHEAFPSYYHSGLTKPMNRVVQRRFLQREHSSVPPSMKEVTEVENYLMELIEKISTKDPSKRVGRGGSKVASSRSMTTKILEEVEDEIVDYEPWMDDYGKAPQGIEFDESDAICKMHPEVWLAPEECKISTAASSAVEVEDAAGVGVVDYSTNSVDKKKKKKKKDSTSTAATDKNTLSVTVEEVEHALEKKSTKKKNKKNKETTTSSTTGSARASVAPSPFEATLLEPPDISRPSSTPLNLDAMNMDGFDFNLEDLGDDDFDMDAIAD